MLAKEEMTRKLLYYLQNNAMSKYTIGKQGDNSL